MTQQPDTPDTTEPDPSAGSTPPPGDLAPHPAPSPPAPRVPLRDRAFSLRSLAAVGLAGLVLGAGAGVGTALVVSGDDDHGGRPGWNERRQPPGLDGGPRPDGGRGGERSGVGPGMGQLPPGMTQQDDSEDVPSDEEESGA